MELDPRTAAAAGALDELADDGLLGAFDLFAEGDTEDETSVTLDRWFDGAPWGREGHRVQQIAHDGGEGMYCLWQPPGRPGPPSVVFFGSEGQLAACADSLEDFVRRLADGEAEALRVYAWVRDGDGAPGPDLAAMRVAVHRLLGPPEHPRSPGPPSSQANPADDFVAWARAVIAERDSAPA